MNHIKQLQQDKGAAEAGLKAGQDAINDFRSHLASSKFHTDTTIQVGDVFSYLEGIVTAMREAQETYVLPEKRSCDAR